jgi:hypothetical protein
LRAEQMALGQCVLPWLTVTDIYLDRYGLFH